MLNLLATHQPEGRPSPPGRRERQLGQARLRGSFPIPFRGWVWSLHNKEDAWASKNGVSLPGGRPSHQGASMPDDFFMNKSTTPSRGSLSCFSRYLSTLNGSDKTHKRETPNLPEEFRSPAFTRFPLLLQQVSPSHPKRIG